MSTVIDNGFHPLQSGAMQPTARVTIRDVAAKAGVSVATVSKVINDHYGVAADTKSRVRTGTADHVGWERRYLTRLSGTLVDGAVLVTPTVVDVVYDAPIVAVDPHTGPSPLPTIDSDNLHGARLAAEHLIGLGHRRIAMLTGRPDLESAALREQGYRQAMRDAG